VTFLLLGTAVLFGTAAQADPPAGPTPKDVAPATKTAVAAWLEWFGFGAPKTAMTLRSTSPPAMNLWVISADAAGRPAGGHALKAGAFNSPLFSADGKIVFALRADTLIAVSVEQPDQVREMVLTFPSVGDHAGRLVGWKKGEPATLGLLTKGARLIGVDTVTGATTEIGTAPLEAPELNALHTAAGVCKDRVVYDGLQINVAHLERTDVFVRPVDGIMGRSITASWPGSVHSEPRFSPDCKRIAFISDER
jgi:hypothetical protein